MRDTNISEFESALADHTAQTARKASTHSTPQQNIARHSIDLPVPINGIDLRIGVFRAQTEDNQATKVIVLDVIFKNTAVEVSVCAHTVSIILQRFDPKVDVATLFGVSGPLVAEHILTAALQKLETLSGTAITVRTVSRASRTQTDHSATLQLAVLSNDIDGPAAPMTVSGPSDILKTLAALMIDAAPDLHTQPDTNPMLTLSLRSPVFGVDSRTARALAVGDVLLLDEIFTGPECCRLWIDTAFSSAVAMNANQLFLSEVPVAQTSAHGGTHWCPTTEEDAAQIVFGSRKESSASIATLARGDRVPFAFHAITQATLYLTGNPRFTGQLIQLPGQMGLRIDRMVTPHG